ncbi:cytochrome P450 [Streptomyces sp. NPDC087917]|uniref:cytochrome P450 n=1 Tax=Streptomyces sp. NPDC087917 TaxID=3155060 RepID=UPI0034267006
MLPETLTLTDPLLYSTGDPHPLWRAMRREQPVQWHQPSDASGFWAVTGYEPGLRVLQEWQVFSSEQGTMLRRDLTQPYPGAGKMLALTDPPHHSVLRRAVARLFTPRSLGRLEDKAREIVRPLVAAAVAAGHCDFAVDVAARIPLALAADLLGVPVEDVGMIAAATARISSRDQDDGGLDARIAHLELLDYYSRIMASRRADPGDDLMSALVTAQADGVGLTDEEALLTCDNVIVAVGDTTRAAAAGGMLALLEHPRQWAALKTGRVDPAQAVDEILRWSPPATHLLRTAVQDTVLAGQRIAAGDPVTVWIPSLNRDESVFGDADVFRLDRTPNRHLTFGGGVHFCLGAALARLVLRVLLEELVVGTGDIALAGEPRRLASYTVGGLAALPVRLTAPAAAPRDGGAGSPALAAALPSPA